MSEKRAMVVVPGARGGPGTPGLYYAGKAAENLGAEVREVTWREAPPMDRFEDTALVVDWVRGQVEPVVEEARGASVVLTGKSLATVGAGLAADRGLPAIWLTPLLHDAFVVSEIRRSRAPKLLIGGTADFAWNGEVARELSEHVCEIPGMDHGLFVEKAPLAASAEALGTVATAMERFLEDVAWVLAVVLLEGRVDREGRGDHEGQERVL
ncbi:MAG TPA: alpha/beta hydrolase [Stackebrandtia sp.]|jgi:hypothetical protein|uniref:alpha/beta hydrolase n=1 Tax=Stackebrandtia sp. TaxID=2023065 RepID=UPI002D5B1292|nr:alpha/beta hydrolase [Stackebrandtia sp.]HZE37512.1 alpha/beta hydrolase [Stackebrandtia sp.]